ncbi:MAG: DUF433 domain-containing protein [Gammaproteobacteria bacterium]|nr:DUF433 domain-containing protein [Gammaproteobacteria bacterium]
MPLTADLTIRETAALSGVSRATVEKAIETQVMKPLSGPARLRGGAVRYLPMRAVIYFRALKEAKLNDLPVHHKRSIWLHVERLEPLTLQTIEFSPGTTLDLARLAANSLRQARRYCDARDRNITSDPEILGGTPVIAGTRIPVYAILGRLQGGDTLDDLAGDYPHVPTEAFKTAELYARAHPLRGRPSGRPWRNAA